MYTILAGMDEYYSKNLASNVKRALNFNAHQSLFNGGIAPLGYDVVDRKYVINEKEKEIVMMIFNMYLDGYSYSDIINKCNELNYKTKKGLPFRKNSIYAILHNEKYTGTYIYNKGTKNNHKIERDDIIKIENAFEPIITIEMFKKITEKTKQNQTIYGEYSAKEIYLLSGLIFCGKCNSRFTGQTLRKEKNGNTYISSYYSCSNRNKIGKCTSHRINRYKLEEYIVNTLIKKILNGNSIDQLVDKIQIEYNKLKINNKNIVDTLKSNLNDIERKINNLLTLVDENPEKIILNRISMYQKQAIDIENKISMYDVTYNNTIDENKIAEVLNKDIKLLTSGSQKQIKKLVQKYIKKITVFDDTLEIEYTFGKDVLNVSSIELPLPYTFKTIIKIVDFTAKKSKQ